MPNAIVIEFDHWPTRALFTNQAGKKLHWAERSELRHTAREEAYFMALNKLDKPFETAHIRVFVTAGDGRKRDLDGFPNAVKPWIDGLVDAGIVTDDNYFIVDDLRFTFLGVGERDLITIVITEGEAEDSRKAGIREVFDFLHENSAGIMMNEHALEAKMKEWGLEW